MNEVFRRLVEGLCLFYFIIFYFMVNGWVGLGGVFGLG